MRGADLGKVVGKGSVDGGRNSVVLKRAGGIIELVIEERRKWSSLDGAPKFSFVGRSEGFNFVLMEALVAKEVAEGLSVIFGL